MKAYVVGGAVRDELLGLPLADRDWVVVGTTPEQMSALGFKPVGRDFPVFLHPATHEEYALARTERKSGRGYKGFTVHAAPDVTLEEDLRRRDLTINAMAKDESGALIDPYGGAADLKAGVLRHVSESFAEDPLRILRVARFAARFGFRVAGETMALMRAMVQSGEAQYLVPERLWQELARGLMEPYPERLFAVLEASGYRAKHLAELKPDAAALARAAEGGAPLTQRFALLAWPLGPSRAADMEALCERLRVPNEPRELALTACRCRALLAEACQAPAERLLEALKCADAFRRPERFADLLATAQLAVPDEDTARGTRRLQRALEAAQSVDAGAIARGAPSPKEIPGLLDRARVQAIAGALGE